MPFRTEAIAVTHAVKKNGMPWEKVTQPWKKLTQPWKLSSTASVFFAGQLRSKTGCYVKNITSYVKNITSYVKIFT